MALHIVNALAEPVHVSPAKAPFWSVTDAIADTAELIAAIVTGVEEVGAALEGFAEAVEEAGQIAEELQSIGHEVMRLLRTWKRPSRWTELWRSIKRTANAVVRIREWGGHVKGLAEDAWAAVEKAVDKLEKLVDDLIAGVSIAVDPGDDVDVFDQSFWSNLFTPSTWADVIGLKTITLRFVRADGSHVTVGSFQEGTWTVDDDEVTFEGETSARHLWHDQPGARPLPAGWRSNAQHAPSMAEHDDQLFLVYGLGDRCYWACHDEHGWSDPIHLPGVRAVSAVAIAETRLGLLATWFDGTQYRLSRFDDEWGQWSAAGDLCQRFDEAAASWFSDPSHLYHSPVLAADPEFGSVLFAETGVGEDNAPHDDDPFRVRAAWLAEAGSTPLYTKAGSLPEFTDAGSIAAAVELWNDQTRVVLMWPDRSGSLVYVEADPNDPNYIHQTADVANAVAGVTIAAVNSVGGYVAACVGRNPDDDPSDLRVITFVTHRSGPPKGSMVQVPSRTGWLVDEDGGGLACEHRPAVAVHDGHVHLVWRDPDDERVLHSGRYPADRSTDSAGHIAIMRQGRVP